MSLKPVSNTTAEQYVWGNDCDGWHLLKREDLSVIQEKVPPRQSEIKHYHSRARQFFYILEGEATIVLEDVQITLRQGEGLEVPPQVAHQFRNDSPNDVVFLVISAPKSHGDRVTV